MSLIDRIVGPQHGKDLFLGKLRPETGPLHRVPRQGVAGVDRGSDRGRAGRTPVGRGRGGSGAVGVGGLRTSAQAR